MDAQDHFDQLAARLEEWKAAATMQDGERQKALLNLVRMSRDPYVVLGVSPYAADAEIRAAYSARIRQFRPGGRRDGQGDAAAQSSSRLDAEDFFRAIARAAHILLVPEQRRLYDRGDIDIDGRLTFSGRKRLRRLAWHRAARYYFFMPFCAGVLLAAGLLYVTSRLTGYGPALGRGAAGAPAAVGPGRSADRDARGSHSVKKLSFAGKGGEFLMIGLAASGTSGSRDSEAPSSAREKPASATFAQDMSRR